MAPSHANGHGPSGWSPHEMRGSRFLELPTARTGGRSDFRL